MHKNSLQNIEPNKWRPGESGNPNGRPARARLTEQFVSDLSTTWAKHGSRILEDMARKDGRSFAHLAAKLVPQDVSLTLQERLPGDLDPDSWSAMLGLLEGIKTALPADRRSPREISEFVAAAIHAHSAKVIEG
jgi:hypothetical protein